jgi:hypothetical protein
VTGSAVAMATNASAGVIYFNQAVTVGPMANVVKSDTLDQTQKVALKSAMGGKFQRGCFSAFFQRWKPYWIRIYEKW